MASETAPSADASESVHEAKEPISVIAGPYGHPFHPILVTVPIGAWTSSLIFDVVSRTRDAGAPSLVDASYWLIGIGVVGALAAAIFGLLDFVAIPRETPAFRVGLTHLTLNLGVMALYIVNFAWRLPNHAESDQVELGQLALSIVAIGMLSVSGWLGGKLAYRYGVRVAEQSDQEAGYLSKRV